MTSAGVAAPGADGAGGRIRTYVEVLEQYHGTLDLTSDRALERIETLLADARAYAQVVGIHAGSGRVLDVGSGAGLPAVVIAAHHPDRPMVWVERRRRRATFLRIVAARCQLHQVRVLEADVRRLRTEELGGAVAAVTAQAVAGFRDLHRWTSRLHGDAVTMIARRGGDWSRELQAWARDLSAEVQLLAAEPLEGGGTLVAVRVPGGRSCP